MRLTLGKMDDYVEKHHFGYDKNFIFIRIDHQLHFPFCLKSLEKGYSEVQASV